MTNQTAQVGTVLITEESIRVSRAIQSPTLGVFVLTVSLVPWLSLATIAGVLIPRGRRGARYL